MVRLAEFPITRKWPAEHPQRIQLYSLPTPNGKIPAIFPWVNADQFLRSRGSRRHRGFRSRETYAWRFSRPSGRGTRNDYPPAAVDVHNRNWDTATFIWRRSRRVFRLFSLHAHPA